MEHGTNVARAWHLSCISRRNFKFAIIVDLTLGVLLRCAHLRLDGIGGRDSHGETTGPNSLAGFASAWMVAEFKAAIGAGNTIRVGVNLTGILGTPNLIFVTRW